MVISSAHTPAPRAETLPGTLAIVGTFLVRSGILSSIHAFVSDPTLNISFVVLISVMVIGSISLVIWRRDSLRTEAHLDSLISREAVFLFQNLVLVALAAVIFWVRAVISSLWSAHEALRSSRPRRELAE